MGLTGWVANAAVKRVHVMIVEAPGSGLLRMRVEAAVTARGWALACAPADSDALLVCGRPEAALSGLIDSVWQQVPAPRARAIVTNVADLSSTLDAVVEDLRDTTTQRMRSRSEQASKPPVVAEMSMDHSGHDMDMPHDTGHSGHEMGQSGHDMDHSGHGMDMSGPGGIPLAEGSEDRDGLEMDATHLTLGPILSDWPAALVVHCTLHGDLVTDVEIEWGEADELPAGSVREDAARLCDAASRVLAVVGWDPMAARARRVRNDLLDDAPLEKIRSGLTRLTRRAERSRTLAWSAKGIAADESIDPRGTLVGWLRTCSALLDPEAAPPSRPVLGSAADSATSEVIRSAVVGQELSTVRLIVASLGLEHAISRERVPRG
ncbi:MAG: hypothetical protein ABGX78_13815 [Microbacterium sp.]|jgi:hypothetical protein|uniref:hypothetical protein n=1 Tax=unclassified Microbacterium TaxID=2609290 RepID=UPI00051A7B30|nr:hypothetical protein [Microbacterium sp. UBA837]HCM50340.1 hypothetical protein [Microbacterium sp.]|tara:strand:+ start:962 stop:2092 length:1131 start_codon:yes stop_codon:yes gene_type:complete